MRIVLVCFVLFLSGPVCASEFIPPPIVVIGERSPDVTKASVTQEYLLARPWCTKLGAALTQNEQESDTEYRKRQSALYIFCMAEQFAALGLSVYEDVPRMVRN